MYLVGDTRDRERIFSQLHNLEIELISSCMALGTGFDLPSASVALLMRPTLSVGLHEQQIGRVARIAEGKTCGIVIDAAGNVKRHGFPCDKVHTKESVLAPAKPQTSGDAPVKVCPECDAIARLSDKVCPACGYEFVSEEKSSFVPTDYEEIRPLAPDEVVGWDGDRISTGFPRDVVKKLRELIATGKTRGYKKVWLAHAFCDRYPARESHLYVVARILGYKDSWAHMFLSEHRGNKNG